MLSESQNGIGRCPSAGSGVNQWINKRVLQMIRFGFDDKEIRETVIIETAHCGRNTIQDIQHSLETGKGFIANNTGFAVGFPSLDITLRQQVLAFNREHDIQFWRNKSTLITNQEVLFTLFQGEKICIGRERYDATIVANYHFHLPNLQFIVPSPALGYHAKNKQGQNSARCLNNIADRWYLVIEFDDDTLSLDDQARLHANIHGNMLNESDGAAGLVMLVYSGNKSLHGWYDVYGFDCRPVFNYACQLGADPHTWVRCQYVRIPGGVNKKTSKVQSLVYFNGDWWK